MQKNAKLELDIDGVRVKKMTTVYRIPPTNPPKIAGKNAKEKQQGT